MSGDGGVTQRERDVGNPLGYLVERYARPHAGRFVLGLGALTLARIPQRIPALMIGVALDGLLFASEPYAIPLVPQSFTSTMTTTEQLWFTVVVLGLAVVAESGLDWLAQLLYDRATLDTLHDVRTTTYEAVVGLEMGYFDDRQSGEIMSVLNNDVANMEDLATGTYNGVTYVTELVVALAFMALLNWQLAIVVALTPLALGITSRLYANLLEPRYDIVRESVGSVNARLEDAIDGISTVKAFTREDEERARVEDASAAYKESKWSAIRLRIGYDFTTWLLGRAGERGLFLLGGYWVLFGPPAFFTTTLTAGTLVTFLMYARSFLHPVRNLAVRVIDNYENALASGKRVVAVLASPAVAEEDDDAPAIEVTEGRVEYDDVSFAYDGADEPAIRDVHCTVEPGELVGIVGSTGAGKSTLIKLLFRFYDPDEGTIRVDGQDVADVDLRSLRDHVGYVSQDPFLFYGTVRENVAYARPAADHEEVVAAAKLAGAHEFVSDLPAGYDTTVGERGVKLSGGQRQRIAVARAILRDPEILVLDEATSHVDNETELQIQQSLGALAGDRTTFVIAHRLSTVRDADRILVMDEGELVEDGGHDELLDADGLYADLWRVQVGDVGSVSDEFVDRAVDREEVAR
ncbi:ATP-binding cassette, subfamily B [Halomicrobium zhouii]|uniref:ATP-binding cassette, subfamily B n=1 Tax=Halomicrobium zhouii TaxID=767519 RepID=A0A1I6LRD0_9EURY|nr:ABC transporter ATP-binding protein [Halomicrobium zhouii]SFS05978.1 ATP-binding cassette, subfamily B [Halomicrobium zhouii]